MVVCERSLCVSNSSKAVNGFFQSCNELVIVEGVRPSKVDEEWIGDLAWLTSGWAWECRRGVCVGKVALEEGLGTVREEGSTLRG